MRRIKNFRTLLLTASFMLAMLLSGGILQIGGVPQIGGQGVFGQGNLDQLSFDFSHSYALAAADKTSDKKGGATKWTCPMHPHYIADEFGSCPICGMDLVAVQSSSAPQDKAKSQNKNETVIKIQAHTIQKMGVRTAKAEIVPFGRLIRSYGVVKENERLLTEISARVEGWIEKLQVTAVGDHVEKGDQLLELFSPELVVSQRDYLTALRAGGQSKRNITQRLLSFGVQEQVLSLLKRKREIMQTVPFYADRSGTISELNITPGTYVKRGMTIAKIQDYSNVWVMVNVTEKDMSFLSINTPATVYFPNSPGKKIRTKVDYIYPEVDDRTRTGRIRLVIDNKDGDLRPGTYADVVFESNSSQRLSVPSEAVLKSERGDFVVVSLGNGEFSSREVKLGLVTGGRAEIKSGIKTGDKIVISAQFLIDSESTLQESFAKFEKLQLPLADLKLSKTQYAMFDHMVDAALYLHETLIDGSFIDPKLLDPALSIKNLMWPDFKNTKLSLILIDAEMALKLSKKAKTKTELKEVLSKLITAIEPWLIEGDPTHYKALKLMFYKDKNTGNKWLQAKEKTGNPYGDGEGMLISWPDNRPDMADQPLAASMKKDGSTAKDSSMRGSHGGMHE